MDWNQAVATLEEGFCLWVGAGLTKHLAGKRATVPLWDELTMNLERVAGVVESKESDYPDRLESCKQKIGKDAFQKFLRKKYYTEFCYSLLKYAAELLEDENFIPEELQQAAALGQLANPIVSFNIEPLSSVLLGRPAGPIRVLAYLHDRNRRVFERKELFHRFQRIIYHPHGLITGTCVMTKSDYEAKNQSLAFGLAIHAAFGNSLAIVGMSLKDKYLRQHIQSFRSQIKDVLWFDSSFDDASRSWAQNHDVKLVLMPWSNFWKSWASLGVRLDETELCAAWYLTILEASHELEGGALGAFSRSFKQHLSPNKKDETLEQMVESWMNAGEASGELGEGKLVIGMKPSEITSRISGKIAAEGIELPTYYETA